MLTQEQLSLDKSSGMAQKSFVILSGSSDVPDNRTFDASSRVLLKYFGISASWGLGIGKLLITELGFESLK